MSQKTPSYKDLEIVKNEYSDREYEINISINIKSIKEKTT